MRCIECLNWIYGWKISYYFCSKKCLEKWLKCLGVSEEKIKEELSHWLDDEK